MRIASRRATGLRFTTGYTDAATGLRVMSVEIIDGSGGIATVEGFDDAHTSADPPQVGSHVDIAAAPGGAFQSLLPVSPERDINIDLGSTGRLGVRAWHR